MIIDKIDREADPGRRFLEQERWRKTPGPPSKTDVEAGTLGGFAGANRFQYRERLVGPDPNQHFTP
jgi:hypothetical protein